MPHSATSAATHNGAPPPLPEPAPAPAKMAVAAALDRHSSMHARTLQQAAEDCNRRVNALLALDPDSAAAKSTTTTTTTTPPHVLRAVQSRVRDALAVIDDALARYPSPDSLSLSYNGGKDCLVLLLLLLAALARRRQATSTAAAAAPYPATLQAVYILARHPFAEVDAFVEASCAHYALDLARFPAPMKPALAAYLAARPAVEAVFVGTRRTDPHGENLTSFDLTDGDWPRFMRVHPVVDWHYTEIWGFIRAMEVEYCPLYDQGYTSLGGTNDTLPNPALKKEGAGGEVVHRPAYELVEDDEERLGRDR
ncbi:FAD synthase like protein [Verticillium longisporum]|uniref:FAD synthase n=3 Tax=Verticillium TaxID=1036719 RepID=G2XCW4_VERDV|nr:FAD synthetase [Verticillium dahliae VdLs.17]KAG7143299.1 FAD synthase like protein [Verticillium longisporum]KAH6706796.1 FAD synthetase [Verticillium dahliae]EGY16832.1 FAD synthetase [Verticillium dahliae VdLs.17]PNH27853.1 hypothetical protein BJF96_g8847 [Verticillium dahliae]PNH47308.1 hypothetical protein VD0004_g985 [Verticillium dahliae]